MFWKRKEPSLMKQVCEIDNLVDAWRKVRSNVRVADRKHSQGVDMVSLEEFEANWKENMADLAMSLEDGTYLPMPLKRVKLRKKDGGYRTICILSVQDRIAQRAVLNVLEPIFEEIFLDCSYGFRPGRSVQDAIERIIECRAQGYTWVVDADIKSFFDSVDHEILMGLLKRYIRDEQVLHLIRMWLKVGVLGMTAAEEEESRQGFSIPFESLFELTKNYIEQAVDWGIEQLLGQEKPLYSFAEEESLYEPLDEEKAKEEAMRRLARDLLLLLLSFSKPVFRQAKKLPSLSRRASRVATPSTVAVGVAMALVGALVPLARKFLAKDMGPVGTPQGSPISPLLANVYLHEFDTAMTRRGYKLVRYADDFVILCHSEKEARQALADAEKALDRLKLRLNPAKTRIVPFDEGFTFLGTAFAAEGVVGESSLPRTERVRARIKALRHMASDKAETIGRFLASRGKKLWDRVKR